MDFSICLPHFVDCLQLFDCNATTRICVQLCFGKMGSRGICFFAKWDPEVLGHSPGVHGSLRTRSPCHHWEMKYVVAPAVGSEEMCELLFFIIFSRCLHLSDCQNMFLRCFCKFVPMGLIFCKVAPGALGESMGFSSPWSPWAHVAPREDAVAPAAGSEGLKKFVGCFNTLSVVL